MAFAVVRSIPQRAETKRVVFVSAMRRGTRGRKRTSRGRGIGRWEAIKFFLRSKDGEGFFFSSAGSSSSMRRRVNLGRASERLWYPGSAITGASHSPVAQAAVSRKDTSHIGHSLLATQRCGGHTAYALSHMLRCHQSLATKAAASTPLKSTLLHICTRMCSSYHYVPLGALRTQASTCVCMHAQRGCPCRDRVPSGNVIFGTLDIVHHHLILCTGPFSLRAISAEHIRTMSLTGRLKMCKKGTYRHLGMKALVVRRWQHSSFSPSSLLDSCVVGRWESTLKLSSWLLP